MRTILHSIETAGPGGAENVLLSLVRGLDSTRFRSIVLLRKEGWLTEQIRNLGVETVVIPLGRLLDLRWIAKVRALVREKAVDVIHAHEYEMNSHCTLVASIAAIPCITTIHGKNHYANRWCRRVMYRYVSRHSKMIAVSRDIRAYLHSHVGIRESDVDVIHNGIDTDVFAPDLSSRLAVRQDLGISPETPLIGALGNLYPVKGYASLIEAMALVAEQIPGIKLFIAGRGQLLDELQDQARNLGVSEDIMFLGFRSDVRALVHAMDIFVMSSLSEGVPLSLLEAMAAEKPVVATAVGGIPEVVDERAGILCRAGDPQALANSLLRLLNDRERARQLGVSARECVLAKFTFVEMRKQYELLYEKLSRTIDPRALLQG